MKQNSENQSHSMQNVYALKDIINQILLHLLEFNLKKPITKNIVRGKMLNVKTSEKYENSTLPFIPSDEFENPKDLLVAGEHPKTSTENIKWNKELKCWEY